MEAIRTALAQLVALEARATEIVNAGEAIGSAGLQVVKAIAASMEDFHARLVGLEEHMSAVTQAPAIASDVTAFEPPAAAPQPLPIVVTPGVQAEEVVVPDVPVVEPTPEPTAAVEGEAQPPAETSGT